MHEFHLVRLDDMVFRGSEQLASMYKLSPCVWQEDVHFELLLRVVNYSDIPEQKVARIHHGTSTDGLTFTLEEQPAIAPGPDVPGSYDSGGCEDPTLAYVDGTYYVYYSGWNQHLKGDELLLASGPNMHQLQKQGIALASSESAANPKEATIVEVADGTWRLFFEYAHENRSKIGLARSSSVGGPWKVLEPLFEARADMWDCWHLSTGPILGSNPQYPVMFYNGATQDAHWRIGWIVFNADYTQVLSRCVDPLILPHIKRNVDDTDIAFAASALEVGGDIHLYYSVADQYCTRAIIRRP